MRFDGAAVRPYDCEVTDDWEKHWSSAQLMWCCSHAQPTGCPNPSLIAMSEAPRLEDPPQTQKLVGDGLQVIVGSPSRGRVAEATDTAEETGSTSRGRAAEATDKGDETGSAGRGRVAEATGTAGMMGSESRGRVFQATDSSEETGRAGHGRVAVAAETAQETRGASRDHVAVATDGAEETGSASRGRVAEATDTAEETGSASRGRAAEATDTAEEITSRACGEGPADVPEGAWSSWAAEKRTSCCEAWEVTGGQPGDGGEWGAGTAGEYCCSRHGRLCPRRAGPSLAEIEWFKAGAGMGPSG
ncbi:unnamed protein product [Prorocentrum cordatum]|uniref:Subtilisin n=1 Tax=Prorocentrum cordatum TaxID=2364126 RepID=A0ABN9TM23_9DINO|nr:unnamed protein product [Polarella glacialis]